MTLDRKRKSMSLAPIERLSDEIGNQIRAPAIICSFHNVVEELVLNSLDAGANCINVAIDMQNFIVECQDNGIGIDLCGKDGTFFGKWQCTSKHIESSDTSFGFRGEAIAAINSLSSDFGIVSKKKASSIVRRGSKPTFFKNEINRHWQSGTVIKAGNIFGSLAVRQKSIRISKEIARIKEFFQKMCLLHHSLSLSLTKFEMMQEDHSADNIKSEIIFRQTEQESVYSMFRSIHGEQPANQLTSVDYKLHGFRISGLMSPPLPQFCHWTREYQYSYLGKRWMRGQDFVTHCINRVFTLIFSAAGVTKGGGPAAKHADPVGRQTRLYPMFVLQLTCNPSEYDMLLDPDKTKVVFRRRGQLQACLLSLIFCLIRQYVPNFPAPEQFVGSILEAEGFSSTLLAGFNQDSEEDESTDGDEKGEEDNFEIEGSDHYFNQPSPPGSTSPLAGHYRDAFVPSQSPPLREGLDGVPPRKKNRVPSLSPSMSTASSPLHSPVEQPANASLNMVSLRLAKEENCGAKKGAFPPFAPAPWFYRFVNDDKAIDFNQQQDSGEDRLGLEQGTHASMLSFDSRPGSIDRRSTLRRLRQKDSDVTTLIEPHYSLRRFSTLNSSLGKNENLRVNRSVYRMHTRDEGMATDGSADQGRFAEGPLFAANRMRAMTINKEQLVRAVAIGQVDRKYLLMCIPSETEAYLRKRDHGVLVMADQHAVDERIRLEDISRHFDTIGDKEIRTCEVRITVDLDVAHSDTLESTKDILAAWGFRWRSSVFPPSVSSSKMTVELSSVPIIHDTPLKKTDFVEFVDLLTTQRLMGMPPSLLRPPAVTRILASRACRNAIKFGDVLTQEQCEGLIAKLGCTDYPFQCAHGRVSVKPVLSLQALVDETTVNGPPKPSHSRFRFSSLMVMTPPSSKIFRYGSDVAIAEENLVLGNWAEAEKMAREAMKIAETMDAESGNNKTASFKNVFQAFANGILADALYHEGKYQEAADQYRVSLHQYEGAWQATNARSPETVEMVGATQLIASSLLDNEEDYDAAVRTCQVALGLTSKLLAPDSREVAFALTNLARAYMLAGDSSEAVEALLKRGIELLKHPQPWTPQSDDADPLTREINYESELMSTEYLNKAYSLLGDYYTICGNLDRAVQIYSDAADHVTTFWEDEQITEPESDDMIEILEKLSALLFSRDELKRSEDLARRALWSLELKYGLPSKKADESNHDDTNERSDQLQEISDLKSLIQSIHNRRRQEQEQTIRDDTANW